MDEKEVIDTSREGLVLNQDNIYEINLDSKIISWNRGAVHMYGWEKNEAMGKTAYELFKTDFHLNMYDFITKTMENYIWTGELTQHKRDGSKIIVASHAILHRDEAGKPEGIIFVNTDITGAKKIEETLRLSEEKFAVTLNSIGDGVLATDAKGFVTFLNPIAEQLTGWTQAKAVGRPVEEIFNIINYETRKPVILPVMETLAHGTVLGLANHTILIARDGSERHIADSCAPILGHDKKVAGAVLVFRDVTERMEKDMALEVTRKELAAAKILEDESREYSESIINTVRESLIALDQDLRVVSASRSFYEFFRVKPGETVGQLIYDLGNKQWDIPKLRELLETILPQKATFDNYVVEHDFAGIGRRIMLLNARQIQRVLGKERIILLAIEDITERREIENGLEKTRKELEATKISEDAAREYAESMINTIREPLIALDQDLRIVTASRSFYEFFKVKPADTVGQLIYDLGNKQWNIPKLRELLETILPQKATFDNYMVEHDFAGIGRRIMLLNARQIQRVLGKERIILLAIEDITERREIENGLEKIRAEQQQANDILQASEEKFAVTIASIGDGVMATDTDGHVTILNTIAEKLTGWTQAEARGRPVEEIFNIINQATRKPAAIPVKETLARGIIQGLANHTVLISRDGSECHIADSCAPIRDHAGRVIGAVLVFRDVSERVEKDLVLEKTRKELAVVKILEDAAREYAESMINTIREPLIALDQNLRVVTASRSFYEFFKVKPGETVGQLIYDLGNKQWDIPKLRELLETILPRKTTFDNYVVEHEFAGIGRRIMLLNARQIVRASGKERIILLAIEDITERREIENGLEKARKELEVTKKLEDEAREYAESMINTIREPLIALDQDLRVVTASSSFYKFFKVKPGETVGQLIYDLGNKQWNIPGLRKLLETILPQKTSFNDYEVSHDFDGVGKRVMLLNARQIQRVLGKERIILLAIDDITMRREIENGLEKARKELEITKKLEDEAREYAESMINTIREPLIALDQDLRVVTASRSFYEFFKVKPAETVGKLIYDLGNKQWNIPKLRELLEKILPQKTSFDNYEVQHNFVTIGKRIMLLNARQIKRVLGKERIILLAIEDITERRIASENLNKFNRTLRAISSANKVLMHTKSEKDFLDKVCEIIVRDRVYKLAWVGFAEDDALKTVRPAAHAGFEIKYLSRLNITWDETERGRGPTGTAVRTGKTAICKDIMTSADFKPWRDEAVKRGYSSSIALPLKSGRSVFGVLTLYSADPDPFSDAEVKLLEELAFDLSYGIMLIRIREKNKSAEWVIKKVATFPQLDPNPISEIDVSGRIHYMNPAFKQFFPDAEKNPMRHAWFEGVAAIFKTLKGKRKKIVKRELQVQEKYFLQKLVYMPVENTIRTYGVDITKRKKTETELHRVYSEMEIKVQQRTSELVASKHLADIGTLAATVAHELRNPLGVINVAAYNLRKKAKTGGRDLLKHVDNIEKKVAESGQIINNLLVYSKMKMPVFGKTGIYELLEECAAAVKDHFGGRKIQLKKILGPLKGLVIDADPLQIREIFTNLITNAYQALENKKGTVTVKAVLKPDNRLSISVKDDGMGINKEDMANIYKPFFTRKSKGTGLGLVICRDMVNMHNGTIDIKSSPGRGSIFTVNLPTRRI